MGEARARVAITGLGMVTPVGQDVPSTWAALLAGRSGVGPIQAFDATGFRTRIAAEVTDFDPAARLGPKLARRLDRGQQFAVAAADEALRDAGLVIDADNAERVGVLIGTGGAGLGSVLHQDEILRTRGEAAVSPFLVPMFLGDMFSGHVSLHLGARGPCIGVQSACATGADAIGEAAEWIRGGRADAVLAGGADAVILPIGVAGFGAMRALSRRNEEPERASRPFDRDRDGMVLGEGAGVVVLERLEHAQARGARVYAELVGYGATADAQHVTAPVDDGEGLQRAVRKALGQAGLAVEEVGYINAHATSTPQGDAAESVALQALLGHHAPDVPISSTKSMTGHMVGAAGAVEAIICVLAIRDGMLPPTINLEHPEPACDLDYIPQVARAARVDVALSTSLGFGGRNTALVLTRPAVT